MQPHPGDRVDGGSGTRLGRIDAVFADYVLVRTRGLLPTDLYVPRPELAAAGAGRFRVDASASDAYERWHRPLRSAPHA